MSLRAYTDHLAILLTQQADAIARENGASRDRTLDQYRYQSGIAAGLRQAAAAIEDELKRMLADDD